MSYLSFTKNFTGPDQVILRKPERYMPIVAFLEQTSRQPSELSLGDRELIASYISAMNGSSFCTGIHNGVASAFGSCTLEAEKPTAPLSAETYPDKLKPILEMVKVLVAAPEAFAKPDVQGVLDAGWGEQTVEDVIGLVASVTVYNILSIGFGFKDHTADYFKGLGSAVKENGYEPLFQGMLEAAE